MDYLIHNGSRARGNRTLRANMPVHGGHKQYVMDDFRLVRSRPIQVTKEKLNSHLLELIEKEAQGLLYVTDMELAPVDLQTLNVVGPPLLVEAPIGEFKPDVVANDPPAGRRMSQYGNELPPPKDFEMPVAAPAAALENNPLVEDEVSVMENLEAEDEEAALEEPVGSAPKTQKPQQQFYGKKNKR